MSLDFDKRLERAIQRGQTTRDLRGRAEAERELTAEELKSLHSRSRLELADHIEECLRRLADHFPGFVFKTVMSDAGWGAQISRDDLGIKRGAGAGSFYSRLEIVVSPLGTASIIELVGKGTIRNKEVFHRRNFQQLAQVDIDSFRELVDLWVLEFAELFAADA